MILYRCDGLIDVSRAWFYEMESTGMSSNIDSDWPEYLICLSSSVFDARGQFFELSLDSCHSNGVFVAT